MFIIFKVIEADVTVVQKEIFKFKNGEEENSKWDVTFTKLMKYQQIPRKEMKNALILIW